MKKKSLAFFIVISIALVSCSESEGTSSNSQVENNYFPLVLNNTWDYENTVSAANQRDIINMETLSISDSSQIGAIALFEFETSNPQNSAPTTLAFSNGLVYKNDNSLVYTGRFDLDIPGFPELNFEIKDGKIYDKSANEGSILFSFSNTAQETIQGLPITIEYTISSVMGGSIEKLTVKSQNYEDVLSSRLLVSMRILPSNTINILRSPNVFEIRNYFAKDVGMIKSETDTNFNFISFPNLPLEDISFFTLQELVSYDVNLE